MYDDIETVYLYLTEILNIPAERIILFGRSIGSGPSCYLAEKYKVAGLMLHAPLMSILRVVFSNLRWTLCFDKFPNIDRIKNFDCPVYIVHGERDEIVHVYHGHRLWENVVNKDFPPYFVEMAGHNNIEKYAKDYLQRVRKFIDHVDQWVQKQQNFEQDEEDAIYNFEQAQFLEHQQMMSRLNLNSDINNTRDNMQALTADDKKVNRVNLISPVTPVNEEGRASTGRMLPSRDD